ncbi:MAG: alpha/beta hydrolase [Ferroplasma sp.]|uniref:alpha/beta fold hydrolase n=1 Tax=Ferroplasma sp. TaxID=2591003 RepID=UPI002815E4F8|nr:alpha/beta hydrolase [Ferroplasma sp.]WMT50975.1 MAG: alpha/beta hydrolase [Ferroplasma sp.]
MEVNENDMEVGGVNIHYISYTRGSGRNFILLHDTSQTSASWAGIDALRKVGQWGYNVYAPDMPGFGKSDSSFKYNFVGAPSKGADFIRDFSEKLYLENIVVVGPSASAGTALKSLIDFNGIIKSAIIIGGLGVDPLLNELNRIDSPVLILWGGKDNMVPIEHGIKYHDLIASSTFVKIDGAGHCVQMEKPDIFFNNVKKFLGEL